MDGVDINVDDGFLPRFASSFCDTYGRDSVFVLAISDAFTGAVARMLESKGMLQTWETVALFGSETAVSTLLHFLSQIPGAKQALLQEALGSSPNVFTRLVIETIGEDRFASWLQAMQASDFQRAYQIAEGRK